MPFPRTTERLPVRLLARPIVFPQEDLLANLICHICHIRSVCHIGSV